MPMAERVVLIVAETAFASRDFWVALRKPDTMASLLLPAAGRGIVRGYGHAAGSLISLALSLGCA